MARVLFIGAHPDDVTTGIGGMVLHHLRKKDEVAEVILTKGTHNVLNAFTPLKKRARIRVAEEKKAERILGIKHSEILNFEDHKVKNTAQTRKVIKRVIDEFKPSIIYAPAFKHNLTWYNRDHVIAGLIVTQVRNSCKPKPKLRYYMTMYVNHLEKVSGADEEKVERALKAYTSQAFELSWYLVLRRAALRWFGKLKRTRWAEGYREV